MLFSAAAQARQPVLSKTASSAASITSEHVADFLHALMMMIGRCRDDLAVADVEYRLVRVLGQILGLGWSQVDLNVVSRQSSATSAPTMLISR